MISKLSFEDDVMAVRTAFVTKSESEQNEYILDFLNSQRLLTKIVYNVKHRTTCSQCWYFCTGVSSSRFQRLKSDFLEGRRSGISNRKGAKSFGAVALEAIDWLDRFANACGDRPPDETANRRVLPACYNKLTLYNAYKDEKEKLVEPYVTYAHFVDLWKKQCPHITISKNTKFTKCGICTLIKEARYTTKDIDLRKQLAELIILHNDQQMKERKKYYKHKHKAKENPSKYCSLILDGMDQHKTCIPHVLIDSKNVPSHFFKTHITGVMSHGDESSFHFIDCHEWGHDSNLTVTLLIKSLAKVAKDGILPQVLYLQMDNCWRENKNQYVLALCSLLVKLNIVRKR